MNIRRRKHCCCPAQQVSSPTQITSSSGGEEQRNKSATPHAHPNRIQLTCPPCNRPTLIERPTVCPTPRRKRSKRSSSRRNNKWPNRMSHTLLLQCPHTYHHMPSSIIPRANHQQIKQHHNHQSTTHPPHHHRHHPASTIHQQQPPFSPGQQQQPTGEQHRASPRFTKKITSYIKEITISGAKRICRFSAAAPSAQCIESPRSHLILDNKPHTHAPRVEGATNNS